MSFRLQMGDEEYRIVGPNGEEGELAEYGQLAELEAGGEHYVALVEDEGDDVETLLPDWVCKVTPVEAVVEDVDFQDDTGEPAEPEEEEEEDEGEGEGEREPDETETEVET